MYKTAAYKRWLVLGFLALVLGAPGTGATEDDRDSVESEPARLAYAAIYPQELRAWVWLAPPEDTQTRDALEERINKRIERENGLPLTRSDWPTGLVESDSLDVLTPDGVEQLELVRLHIIPNDDNDEYSYSYLLETEKSRALRSPLFEDQDYYPTVTLVAPPGQFSHEAEFEKAEGDSLPKEAASRIWESFVARFDEKERRELEKFGADEDAVVEHMTAVRASFGEPYKYAVAVNIDEIGSFSASYLVDETARALVEVEPPLKRGSSVEHLGVSDLDGDGRRGVFYRREWISDETPPRPMMGLYRVHSYRWAEVVEGEVKVRNVGWFTTALYDE